MDRVRRAEDAVAAAAAQHGPSAKETMKACEEMHAACRQVIMEDVSLAAKEGVDGTLFKVAFYPFISHARTALRNKVRVASYVCPMH